jgi:hypothetical protein
VSRLSSPHSASSNYRQGGEGFGNFYKDLSASPALPATQQGRLGHLPNMGEYWKMWIRSTGLQEKKTSLFQYEDVDADHLVVQEDTPPMKVFIGQYIQDNGKDGPSQSIPISYGAMTWNIPSLEIVTHIFMSAWTCQCYGLPHMQGKGEY